MKNYSRIVICLAMCLIICLSCTGCGAIFSLVTNIKEETEVVENLVSEEVISEIVDHIMENEDEIVSEILEQYE